jgi:hypothetical protein
MDSKVEIDSRKVQCDNTPVEMNRVSSILSFLGSVI